MSRRDDLLIIAEKRIIELEAELRLQRDMVQQYMDIIGEMLWERAVARAKELGVWEG